MKIDRESLLVSLRKLKPAIGDKSPIEGLNHIWFNGATAMAYNDIVGIETPCDLAIDGGVLGVTLLGLLEKASGKEIDIEGSEKEVVIKYGGGRAKLPVLAVAHAVNPFTEVESDGAVLDGTFIKALAHVMLSVADSGNYAAEGVTLAPEKPNLALYATDGLTIAWARVPLPKGHTAPRLALSPMFCKQVLALCKEGGSLHLSEDQALAVAMDGTRVLGRLPELLIERPFSAIITDNLPSDAEVTPMPERLTAIIDRVLVLAQGREAKVEVTTAKNLMRFAFKSALGELREAVTLKPPYPGNVATTFNAGLVQRGTASADGFLLNDQAFVMLGEGDHGYIAATPTG